MKHLLTLLLFFPILSSALTVTSLNVEWYGRGGRINGDSSQEFRDREIVQFLTSEIPASDVYVFQEITDPVRLASLFPTLNCSTYEVENQSHQFVVICAKEDIVESFDAEFEVQLGRGGLRPAMILNLKEKSTSHVVSIVGLHLKAGTRETQTRLNQIEKLANSLKISKKSLIIGDFNTFPFDVTGNWKDDHELMEDILTPVGYHHIENRVPTFLGRFPKTLDRAFSRGLEIQSLRVYGPCQKGSVQIPYQNERFYNRNISDHCAVQVKL